MPADDLAAAARLAELRGILDETMLGPEASVTQMASRTGLTAGVAAFALNGVEAALKHHQRIPLYGNASTLEKPEACPHDPEQDWDCHFESEDGEWLCEEKPAGAVCSCTQTEDGERVPYPCDEVADILAALTGKGGNGG